MNATHYHIHRFLRRLLYRGLMTRRDLSALHALAPLPGPYLPWSEASMSPSAIVAILNDVIVNGRRAIVECGSGVSTIYLGRLLKEQGGRLTSIEHDPEWARVIEERLADEGLGDQVTLVVAPLEPSRFAGGRPWYAEERVRGSIAEEPIDLLVVDGPPAHDRERRHDRYPAVPFFADSLADEVTIVLDDIGRRGEQEVVERWEHELGLRFQRRFTAGNIAIGRRGGGFMV